MLIKNILIRSSFIITNIALLVICGHNVAQADGLSVGAGILVEQMPYKDYDRQIYPIPVVSYENQHFFVKGLNVGAYALKTENYHLYAQLNFFPYQFKASKTDNQALKQLDNRKPSMMAGVGYEYMAQWGNIYTNVMADISGKSHGFTADLAYGYPFHFGRLYLEPRIGVEWQNSKFNDYYYGVSRRESYRSGMKSYSADSGSTPYLAINTNYSMNDHWQIFLVARYTRLSNTIQDSPMTSRSSTSWIGTGAMYQF